MHSNTTCLPFAYADCSDTLSVLRHSSTDPPAGTCFVDGDCSSGFFCNTAGSTSQACTCSKGMDTCRTTGVCRPTACTRCRTCLNAMTTGMASTQSWSEAAAVAGVFATRCLSMEGVSSAACRTVREQVANSASGNTGGWHCLRVAVWLSAGSGLLPGCSCNTVLASASPNRHCVPCGSS